MSATVMEEKCPKCGESSAVRPKLLLIDESGLHLTGTDRRELHHACLRADDVEQGHLREQPLEQFLDGFYCDRCDKGFVSEAGLKDDRRRYCRH